MGDERDNDPAVDPTPPVQKFAAHHLVIALAILGALFGALIAKCVSGGP